MTRLNSIRLATCIAFFLTLLDHPSSASACSCIVPGSPAEEFARGDAVFTGRVIRIVDNYAPIFSSLDFIMSKLGNPNVFFYYFVHNDERRLGFSVFFKVINSWKGIKKTLAEVNTGRGDGDCGYQFNDGKEYLVYANPAYGVSGNYWVTGICSGTAKLSNATDDLDYLISLPELPLKFAVPIPWAEKDSITLVSVIILLGVIAFTIRRLRIQRQ